MNLKKQLLGLSFLVFAVLPAWAQNNLTNSPSTITADLEQDATIGTWIKQARKINPSYVPGIWQEQAAAYSQKPQDRQKLDAPGIKPGDWWLSVAYKAADYYNVEYETNLGKGLELSAFYALTPFFALGAGIDYNDTGTTELYYYSAESGWIWGDYSVEYLRFKILGKVTINPSNAIRLYIPFGIGLGEIKEKINETSINTDQRMAYSYGLGVEADLSRTVSFAIEAQSTMLSSDGDFDSSDFLFRLNIKL